MHTDNFTRAIFCGIYTENAGRQARDTRFVRACAVEMHMDMSEEAFCAEIYTENAGRFSRTQRFVRACAVEMHTDISQAPFYVEIYRENAKRPGLNAYRKNPSVWTHCLGKSGYV